MSQLAFSANVVALPLFRGTNSLHSPRLSCKQSPFITSYRAVAKRRRTRLHQALPRRVIVSSDASEAPTETESSNAEPRPRNSTSWFEFRNLRIVLAILSLLGAAETTYLTFNKFFSSPGAICATQGCLDVLSGPFSSFLGIPLTLFGALAYGAFAYMAVWPLAADEEETEDGTLRTVEEVYAARDATTRPLLLALSTALFLFSGYLMALLVFVIQSMCPYCVFSAIVSTALFTLTAFVGRAVPNVVDALRVGAVASGVTSAAAAVLFFIGYPAHIRAQPSGEPQAPPAITMRSTSDTLRIAAKLNGKNTKMYGAYWCTHCYDQKQRFGKKAFSKIEYIECDKHGVKSKYQLCRDKRIPGYPTWEVNGELYPGEIDLPELERLVDENGK